LARRRSSPQEAGRRRSLARQIARRKNGEHVGITIFFFFVYFSDAKQFKGAVGVALT
jgi:hypothetical protein